MTTATTNTANRLGSALPFWASLALIPIAIFAMTQGGWWLASIPLFSWGLFITLDALRYIVQVLQGQALNEDGEYHHDVGRHEDQVPLRRRRQGEQAMAAVPPPQHEEGDSHEETCCQENPD